MGFGRLLSDLKLIGVLGALAILASKVLLSSYFFYDGFVSDEVYYVNSARYIAYRLGLASSFSPPEGQGSVVLKGYDWLNSEHPMLAKLLLVPAALTGDLLAVRAFVLLFALSSLAVYLWLCSRKWWSPILLASLAVLVDGTYIHFTHLAFLDSFMIAFLLLALAAHVKGRVRLSLVLLSLSAMCKEVGLVFFAFPLVDSLARRRWRTAVLTLASASAALALGFAPYLALGGKVGLLGTFTVRDSTACPCACLAGFTQRWNFFTLFTPFVYLHLAMLPAHLKAPFNRELERAAYTSAAALTVLVVAVSLLRNVYPFYYAPLIPLLLAPIEHAAELLRRAPSKLKRPKPPPAAPNAQAEPRAGVKPKTGLPSPIAGRGAQRGTAI